MNSKKISWLNENLQIGATNRGNLLFFFGVFYGGLVFVAISFLAFGPSPSTNDIMQYTLADVFISPMFKFMLVVVSLVFMLNFMIQHLKPARYDKIDDSTPAENRS